MENKMKMDKMNYAVLYFYSQVRAIKEAGLIEGNLEYSLTDEGSAILAEAGPDYKPSEELMDELLKEFIGFVPPRLDRNVLHNKLPADQMRILKAMYEMTKSRK